MRWSLLNCENTVLVDKPWRSNPWRSFVFDVYQITAIVRIRLISIDKVVSYAKNKVLINIYIIHLNKFKTIKWISKRFWQILVHVNYCWNKWTHSFIGSYSGDSKVHHVCRIWIALSEYWQIISRSCNYIENIWEISYVIT